MSEPSTTETPTGPTLAAAMGDPALRGGDTPVLAQVRVVVPLRDDERARLQALLEELVGRPVEMDVQVDPEILGGVWVRMGDLVIDGTIRARLEALDEQLCVQCNLLLTANDDSEGGAR
jgi:hypothetical protein